MNILTSSLAQVLKQPIHHITKIPKLLNQSNKQTNMDFEIFKFNYNLYISSIIIVKKSLVEIFCRYLFISFHITTFSTKSLALVADLLLSS